MTDSTPSTETSAPASTSVETASPSPSSSTPETSRPTSLDEAFAAQGLTGSPDPSTDATAQTAPAPAIVEPAAAPPTEAPAPPDPRGPIPFDRHQSVVQNTREKTAREVVGQVQQHYGPGIEFQTRLRADPAGTISQLISEAVSDPQMGQQITAHLARTLSQRRGQKAASEEPQPDLQTAEGELVYSAGQLHKRETWLRQQMAEEVNQRFAPIEQERQARAEEVRQQQHQQQTRELVTTRLQAWQQQPGFTEHEADIQVRQQHYVNQGMDTWSALGMAYAAVVNEKVVPKVRAESQSSLVTSAFAKANGSASNPASVAPSTQPRPKSLDEAFRQVGLGS